MTRIENLYFVILSVGGLGLFLFYLGWYRRVYDGGSYCRACGYRVDRSGDDVLRCSECGTNLKNAGSVVNYRQNRKRSLITIGILLIALSAAGITADTFVNLNTINWYRYLPSWYLLRTEVTAKADFGNEAVQVLRSRVLDDDLDEKELRRFTVLLCKRAMNLHRNSTGGSMQYTGMTLNLLNDYKPDNADTNALLHALVSYFIRTQPYYANLNTSGVLWVTLPSMQCDPQLPFLHRGDVSSMRLRGEITRVQAFANEKSIPLLESAVVQYWYATFDASDINADEPITLQLTINWYMEDTAQPADPNNSKQVQATPWHTSIYECELTPGIFDGFNDPAQSTLGQSRNETLIQHYKIKTEPGKSQ